MLRPKTPAAFVSAALLASLVAASACSTGTAASDADRGGADGEQTNGKLGAEINACALQRARYDAAHRRAKRAGRIYKSLRQALEEAVSRKAHERDTWWRQNWRASDIQNIEVRADAEGYRISGRASYWGALARFTRLVEGDALRDAALVSASQSGHGGAIDFVLADAPSTTEPLFGEAFDDRLFPAVQDRSPSAYADDLCDFGRSEAPKLKADGSRVQATPAQTTDDGVWQRTVVGLRAEDPNWLIERLPAVLTDYDGVSIREPPATEAASAAKATVEIDAYSQQLAPTFEPADWYARVVSEARLVQTSLSTPPEHDELVTWREEDGYPVGVPRSMMGSVRAYRFRRIHDRYFDVAKAYAWRTLADALAERRAKALRATLCITRAYTAPVAATETGAEAGSTMQVAKVSFPAPPNGVVAGFGAERFSLSANGNLRWQLDAAETGRLRTAREAFAACMGDSALSDTTKSHKADTRWTGEASVAAGGLAPRSFVEGAQPPRFDDGADFVRTIAEDRFGLNDRLTKLTHGDAWLRGYRRIEKFYHRGPQTSQMLRAVSDAADARDVQIRQLRHRPMLTSRWTDVTPMLVELDAEGRPTDVLGFVTQLFDLDYVLVPDDLVVERSDDGERFRVHATLHTFRLH